MKCQKPVLGLLKKILKRRRDLKLIVSSATVDAEYIRDFFNRGAKKGGGDKTAAAATILSVEGRNYSVDVLYQAGLEKPGFFVKKPQPSGFLFVFLFFWGFLGFFLSICPEERVFRVFQFQ